MLAPPAMDKIHPESLSKMLAVSDEPVEQVPAGFPPRGDVAGRDVAFFRAQDGSCGGVVA